MSTPAVSDRIRDMLALNAPHLTAARLEPSWELRDHTRLIGEALATAASTPGARVAISCPPQVGKSQLSAIWAPFWMLARSPGRRIITTSYGTDLATRNGRAVRALVRDYGARYGLELEHGTASAAEWYTPQGGGVKSAGVGAGITGFPADVLLVDDVYKNRAEAESPATREAVWEWLSGSALTRLAPHAPVVMIGTLWTPDDPMLRLIDREGRIEDGGRWRVITLPALADRELTPHGDPLGRADGEPLPHPMIPEGDVEALRAHWADKQTSVLPRDWESLYQCNPSPREGALVSWDVIEAATVAPSAVPHAVRTIVTVDPAGGGEDEVGITVAILGADDCCYIVADASGAMPVTEWPDRVCDQAEEYQADRIVLETNYGGQLTVQPIRVAWQARERTCMMPAIHTVTAKRGKILRAEPIAQQMAMGRFRIVRGLTKLARQWASYRPGQPSPGRLDASVYAAIDLLRPPAGHLVRQSGPRRIEQIVRPPSPDQRRIPGR
ncbi:terminase large subunit domain-containing protein [Streptomyces sp. NBRC 109706]|uniref:terminase large subunit domain-containing protein n=1 Tax=Streptomyces sp. NBRC 109706 TaxID=1550035 RepID=UPI0007830326|nr:terminase family protein [Streptomyces sp. NBRC 109706]